MSALWITLTAAATLLTKARLGFVAAAFTIFLGSFVIVALRWRLILRALGCRATAWDTMLTYLAGLFISNVTPVRTIGADAFRLAVIRSRTDAPVKSAAASIVYDRASEIPAISILVLLTLSNIRAYLWVAVAIATVLAALMLTGPIRRTVASRVAAWHDTVVGVPVGRGSVAAAIGWSMLLYLQDVSRIMLIAAAFGVGLTPSQAATVSVLRLLGGAVPVPGGIGVIEGGMIAGLVSFGIPAATAAAITIVERAILYGCATALGGLSLMLLGGRRVARQAALSASRR